MPHERRAISDERNRSNTISPPMIRPAEISKKLSEAVDSPSLFRYATSFRSDDSPLHLFTRPRDLLLHHFGATASTKPSYHQIERCVP